MARLKVFLYWLLVAAWAAVIFRMSSVPGSDIPQIFPFQDKAAHVIIYFILAFLIMTAVKGSWPALPMKKMYLIAVISAAVYGLSDEIHQIFVPLRSCSLGDLFADVIGALAAVCSSAVLKRKFKVNIQ